MSLITNRMVIASLLGRVLVLLTAWTFAVEAFSSTPSIISSAVLDNNNNNNNNSKIATRLHLFGKDQTKDPTIDNPSLDESSSSSSYANRRMGVLRKEVKKLNGWTTTKFKKEEEKDRHAWKQKPKKSWGYKWRGLKQKVRYLLDRNTVYVLECENSKYYVGSTRNRKQRYREHFENPRSGSKWTRLHKPIRVLAEYKRIPSRYLMGMESQKTADYMMEYGVNNVRGGAYCMAREFTMGDLKDLTSFLGHYQQLDYQELSRELSRVLPKQDPSALSFPPPQRTKASSSSSSDTSSSARKKHRNYRNKLRKKKRIRNKSKAKCYKCGEIGHWASECPNEPESQTRMETTPANSFQETDDHWNLSDEF